jgi:uncharacterized protein YjbJ (UPF0337 family)
VVTLTGEVASQSTRAAVEKIAASVPNVKQEDTMKESTKDELAGKVHEVKGAVKEKVGQVIGNPDLEEKGTGERVAGKVQKKIGQIEKVLEK